MSSKSKPSTKRGVIFSVALTAALFAVGLPPFLALGAGIFGGITANRSLPPKLGDPESWRQFQAEYPDSVKGGRGEEGKR